MESTQLSPPPLKPRPSAVQVVEPPRTSHGHDGDSHDEIDTTVPPIRPVWVVVAGVFAVAAMIALFVTGFIPRRNEGKELAANSEAVLNAPVVVNVITPQRAPKSVDIVIPGNLRPWQEVSLFARTSGYLKNFYVDISNQVQVGQLMAEIETPEVDQQLRQAEASLLQTKAAQKKASTDRDFAKVTFTRFQSLIQTQGVTPQDLDQRQSELATAESNLESANANVAAAEANVQRLTELKQFEKIVAPFAGVVSGRGYDVGSLILADPTGADVKPMFKIAENDILRVFVNVPQSSALTIRKGMDVEVTTRERENEKFTGQVMGTTNYLDPGSRSLLTEVKVPNVKLPDGEYALLPGMYVQVKFVVERDSPPLKVPAPAIINDSNGTRVAIVKDGKAHFQKVVLGQDDGNDIEVVGGLQGDEQVIANPGERVVEGANVQIHSP
jgi:RND family efflux transporter MFP subunit